MMLLFFGLSTNKYFKFESLSTPKFTKEIAESDRKLNTHLVIEKTNAIEPPDKPLQHKFATANTVVSKPTLNRDPLLHDDSTESLNVIAENLQVYGRVADSNDIPIQGVLVTESGQHSGRLTDQLGLYELPLVASENDYRTVIFRRSGYRQKVLHVAQLIDPNIPTLDKIQMNARLEYSPKTVTVEGWIGESNGLNIKGEVIRLSSLQENLYYSTVSDEAGNFTFEGIRLDVKYQLKVKPSAKYQAIDMQNITVTSNNAPIHITLEPADLTLVNGVVVDNYGDPVANFKFKIRSEVNSVYDKTLTTDKFGQFELSKFPMGEILFSTESPEFFKVVGLKVSAASYTNLIVPIDVGDYSLSGWVRDQNGRPIADARAVVDAEFNYNSFTSSSIRTSMTNEAGYFEFNKLGAGEHYITIYAKGFINEGVSYNAHKRIDQLYFQLSQWSGSLITSETLKMNMKQAQ